MVRWLADLPARIAIFCVRCYQLGISPLLGSNCRFQPTCSQYTIAAIEKYGVVWGILRGAWRILRCHPFNKGGFDPP
jgi:uncharacterized protein